MSKVIFLDVDGTLVNYETKIPPSAVEAVRRARNKGHRVYICTGRSRAEVYQEIWDIGLDGMIGGNGSYVEDHGHVLFHQTLTPEECRGIVDWLHHKRLEFYIESNSGLFGSEDFERQGEPAIRAYAAGKGADASALTVRDAFPEMIFGGTLYRDDVNKISYILDRYETFFEAQAAFPALKHGTWGGKGETALFGDIGVKDISKAHAIDVLLESLSLDRADTIAFGDAKIDIPMFDYCDYSVCMGNGGEEAKAAADFITKGVDEDGLYHAFEHLGLI